MTMLIIMTIMCECETVCLLKLDADDFSDFTLGARPGHAQHRGHFILVLPCRQVGNNPAPYSSGTGSKLRRDPKFPH